MQFFCDWHKDFHMDARCIAVPRLTEPKDESFWQFCPKALSEMGWKEK